MNQNQSEWFSVKCIFVMPCLDKSSSYTYEERITIWKAKNFESAISKAEAEANTYAKDSNLIYTKYATAFHLFESPKESKEVYSIMRNSNLETENYLDQFYDTGEECAVDLNPQSKLKNLIEYEETLLKALDSTRQQIIKLKIE